MKREQRIVETFGELANAMVDGFDGSGSCTGLDAAALADLSVDRMGR